MSETDLVRAIVIYLRVQGIFCWRQNTGAARYGGSKGKKPRFVRYGEPGISDVLGMMKDGRFLAIEVKLPGNEEPSDNQKEFMAKVRASKGITFVATCIEDVRDKLELV